MRRTNRLVTKVKGAVGANPGKDIDAERQRRALASTADFVEERLAHVPGIRGTTPHDAKLELLRRAVREAPENGLLVEFGVATGETLREICALRSPAHGFDSFQGLPEDWYGDYGSGTFAQTPPTIDGAVLHIGWFEDTLPGFLSENDGPFAFVHMDADLYSSSTTIFTLARDRFVAGTVILFDEYFNYPGWQQHEHKAFEEFLAGYPGTVEYLAYNAMHEQLAVRLT
jgi:hypothetical protein